MVSPQKGQNAAQEGDRYGRYEVVRKIASGGMGEVYLAKSIGAAGFQKHVVIKKILPHLTEHPQTVKSLVREAKLLVLLNHPNIVQVFDLGVEGTDYFMAMEYVHGYNLSTILHYCSKKKANIPAAACALIGVEVLRALGYAHDLRGNDGTRQNIIHRDVSPQNVMISQSGQVKLTDFGIAKVLSEAEDEHTQSLKGKWRYMAPEALDGGRIDQRYDLFAVGILLFESLCRRNLFSGKRDVDILNQVREARVPDIHRYHPEAPPRLVEVTEKALSKDPEQRYQTARELAEALVEAIHPISESQAADQLRAFVAELYATEDFPLNKPKILDPNAADQDATRSLVLRSRLTDVPPTQERRRRSIAIALLALGLVGLSGVVAYIAYAVLYRDDGKRLVEVVVQPTPDAADPLPPDLTMVGTTPDAKLKVKPNGKGHKVHRPPPAGPFEQKEGSVRFSRVLPVIKRCIDKHRPTVDKIVVASQIEGSGRVTKVQIVPAELDGSPIGLCIRKAAGRVRYPPHNQGMVTFRQPLRLSIAN